MEETGTITTHESRVCEEHHVVEWQVPGFSTLRKDDCAYYECPTFSFGGERWRLGIWPNGWSARGTSGYLDLSLGKWSSSPSIKQTFSLSLKTAEGERYKEEHCTKDFQNFHPENYHFLLRFISRAELSRLRSDLLADDVLTVVCTMRRSTSDSEVCAPGCSAIPHQNNLHYDLKQLFLNKEDCDVTIRVRNLEFPAHKAILKARSPVFASTFRHDMKENATGVLEIEDCDPSTFSDFLCFIYCGDANLISQENVFGLFTAADKYQVLNLRVKCLEFMKKNLSVDTFCETLTLALRHSEDELIRLCTDYFKQNVPKIIEIEDCEPSMFSDFLCYLYCGDANLISQENVFDLFTAADKYQVLNLRTKCLKFMKKNLSVDTFCETLTLALRHSEAELIRLCTDYFKQNAPKIIVTVKWQTFLAENPTESNELLIKSFVPNNT